jgi:multiple sugar transport system substrate-binding protein
MRGKITLTFMLAVFVVTSIVFVGAQVGFAQEKATIVFASMKTYGVDTMPLLIRRFEKANPDINVEFVEMPSPNFSTEIHQYLVTTLAAKTDDVDVFTIDCIWFPEFAEAGWLLPTDKYVSEEEKAEYFPGAIETVSYKGQLVGIPWFLDAGMLYYRTDLLEKYGFEPPETWDELIDQAKAIMEGEGDPNLQGFVYQARQAEVLVCDLVSFLGGDGAVFDKEGKVVIDNDEGLRTAQLMYDLIYKHKISPEAVNTYDEEPSRRIFTDGNAVFLRNWSYVWAISQDPNESKVVDKVAVIPLPHFEGSESASCLGGYQYGVNYYTKHPDEAAKFTKFIASPESQLYFAIRGWAPTRPAVYEDTELAKVQPFLVSLKDVFVYAAPRPITPYYPEISLILQAEFSKLLTDKQTPEETVKTAADKIKKVVGE